MATLQRLKEQLTERGLQVVWTTKQARAHGVGGQAKVIGFGGSGWRWGSSFVANQDAASAESRDWLECRACVFGCAAADHSPLFSSKRACGDWCFWFWRTWFWVSSRSANSRVQWERVPYSCGLWIKLQPVLWCCRTAKTFPIRSMARGNGAEEAMDVRSPKAAGGEHQEGSEKLAGAARQSEASARFGCARGVGAPISTCPSLVSSEHRTVGSTLAAETQYLARGMAICFGWLRCIWSSLGLTFNWDSGESTSGRRAICWVFQAFWSKRVEWHDAKSLYDLLVNETTGGSDKRTALDVQALREEIQELGGTIRWIEHMQMPADVLTKKQGRCEPLKQLLKEGVLGITEASAVSDNWRSERQELGYNKR